MKREIKIQEYIWKPFDKSEIVKRLGRDNVLDTLLIFLERKKGFSQEVIDYIIHDEPNNRIHSKIRSNILNSKENYLELDRRT